VALQIYRGAPLKPPMRAFEHQHLPTLRVDLEEVGRRHQVGSRFTLSAQEGDEWGREGSAAPRTPRYGSPRTRIGRGVVEKMACPPRT
jgi:hypothetical protein